MKPYSKSSEKQARRATARPSVISGQPMAASTPDRRSRMDTAELPSSPPLVIRENAVSSSTSSSVPAPAMAVVRPTSRTTDVANSSLVHRVPRTFAQISGRRAISSVSVNGARYSKERPKEQVPKLKADGPKNYIGKPKVDKPKNYTPKPKEVEPKNYTPKPKVDKPKNDTPKPKAEASLNNATNPKAGNSSSSLKRKRDARGNTELSPSHPLKLKYIQFEVAPIGFLLLNLDQLQQVSVAGTASHGQGNPQENIEPIRAGIRETNDQDPPPAENPDINTDSLPKRDPPRSKKCLIM